MSIDSTNHRIREIERELGGLLETLNISIENMHGDPDMVADIGAHSAARKRRTEEEIEQLEEELRSMRQQR